MPFLLFVLVSSYTSFPISSIPLTLLSSPSIPLHYPSFPHYCPLGGWRMAPNKPCTSQTQTLHICCLFFWLSCPPFSTNHTAIGPLVLFTSPSFQKTKRDPPTPTSSSANTSSILHHLAFGINSTLIYSPTTSIKESS